MHLDGGVNPVIRRFSVLFFVLTAFLFVGLPAGVQGLLEEDGFITIDKTVAPADIECQGTARVTLTIQVTTPPAQVPVEVVLVIDVSGSMEDFRDVPKDGDFVTRIEAARDAALEFSEKLLDRAKQSAQIGIVVFSRDAQPITDLTNNRDLLVKAMMDLPNLIGGSTNISAGIESAISILSSARENSRKIIVLLTDGLPNVPQEYEGVRNTLVASQDAKDQKIEIFTIALGKQLEEMQFSERIQKEFATSPYDLLRKVATSDDHFKKSPTGEDLEAIFRSVAQTIQPDVITNLHTVDTIRPEFKIRSLDPSAVGNVLTDGSRRIEWTIEELRAGETATLSYEVEHNPEVSQGGQILAVNEAAYLEFTDFEGNSRRLEYPPLLVNVSDCAVTPPVESKGIDLVFVIDGSGSIDPKDWAMQIEGIKEALKDPYLVPTDGSIAVALVQFGGGKAEAQIEYKVIREARDIREFATQVGKIDQFGGSTNPGDGINRAVRHLREKGNPEHRQIICMSTDGLNISVPDTVAAIDNAKASTIDQFSVVAIEDPSLSYYGPDFHRFYDPLVFGGGAVTVASETVEFANILASTCLSRKLELELIAIEVNQAIQDWNNSVPLIQGKDTYVRVYVQTKGADPKRARVRLYGARDGNPLPESPRLPDNPGGSIIARTDAASRRGNLYDSFYFKLPQEWLNGTIELKIEGVGGELDCKEPITIPADDPPNDCKVIVSFIDIRDLVIRAFAVEWQAKGGRT